MSREYEILFELRDCDHVVKILDFYYSKTENNRLIQNIVFEFMEDSLENMIQESIAEKRYFSDLTVKTYIYQLFQGLAYMHSKNIAHRDLKPENILVSDKDKVKICDFGSSKMIDPNGKNTPYIVSRYYRAPELIMCVTKYSTAIDIWAAGCILAELILREPIFKGQSEGEQLFAIFKILGSPTQSEYEELSYLVPFDPKLFNEFKIFPGQSLRLLFGYFKDLDNLLDLLSKVFCYIPAKRITAQEALKHPFFNDVTKNC